MARKIIHDGPVNTAVMAWMRGQGIKPEDVRGYTLTYDAGDLMTIDIRMYMNDVAPKPANPPFVADSAGDMWRFDPRAVGYRYGGGKVRSLDYVREQYGIAEVQPPHATCQNVNSPADSVPTWVCGAACPGVRPARVRNSAGNEFVLCRSGKYALAGFGDQAEKHALFALSEIGAYEVIERKYCGNCIERCETHHGPCLTESGECDASDS